MVPVARSTCLALVGTGFALAIGRAVVAAPAGMTELACLLALACAVPLGDRGIGSFLEYLGGVALLALGIGIAFASAFRFSQGVVLLDALLLLAASGIGYYVGRECFRRPTRAE